MEHKLGALPVFIVGAFMIGLSACATAQDPQTNSSQSIEQNKGAPTQIDATAIVEAENELDQSSNDPDEVICKSTRVTGSKFKKRACHTRAEWEEMARAGREFTDNLNRRNRGMIRN